MTLLLILLPVSCFAAWAEDRGKVQYIFSHANGDFAIQLHNGFPQAVAKGVCASAAGWAGNGSGGMDPTLKAVLLTARQTGQEVTVVTDGCYAGGHWLRIIAAYVW